jgi:hypothetical protein
MYTANRPKFSNKNTAPLTAAFFREHNAGITRQLNLTASNLYSLLSPKPACGVVNLWINTPIRSTLVPLNS